MKKQFLETGRISGTHGVRGMVRIQPWSDSAEFLSQFRHFFLNADGSEEIKATSIQAHGNMVIAKFEGTDTVEDAEKLRNKIIYISRSDVKLPEGRYFIDDLIGCKVFDKDGETLLGELRDVSETGANDVWHIVRDGKEYLVPAIADVIVKVDTDKGEIILNPMKGIFDDED